MHLLATARAAAGALVTVATLAAGTAARAAETPHWEYSGNHGPAHWGELSREFATCGLGHEQSPIDITGARKAELPPIRFDYRPAPLQLVDNGHTIQANLRPGSSISVGADRYELVQFHFHHPSEERVEGKPYSMVAHLVHRNAAGRLAVIGVLLESGARNALIDTLWAHLPARSGHDVALAQVVIDAAQLLPPERGYYTYAGSLTTPPCSEGVRWFVLKQPVTVAPEQIETFARRYPNNARPVQPLNARLVQQSAGD
jgi:carbonic anhydrase